MGEVINLRRARKARLRQGVAQAAAEARASHGRTKNERDAERIEAARLARVVEQSRLATGLSEDR